MTGDILFERRGQLAVVTLNRPKALNALTLEMCLALDARLSEYEKDPRVGALLIKGEGERAFCAGGDIRRLYDAGRAKEPYPYEFYRNEYQLNARIFHFPKPCIALMDGIVMGGGVGVSVHGSHRIASERILFAMPETGIGLFPDVGGSYFLSRLPGQLGMFLGLTGERLGAADALYAGVCDAFVPAERLEALEDILAESELDAGRAAVDAALGQVQGDAGAAGLAPRRALIDRCFAAPSVEEILAALRESGDPWAEALAGKMEKKSPTSMKLAFRQIRDGANLSFNDCMRMEYRIAVGCIEGHDFYEGVRATVIDKNQQPDWRPARLEEVTGATIAPYFERTPPGGDLSFPGD